MIALCVGAVPLVVGAIAGLLAATYGVWKDEE